MKFNLINSESEIVNTVIATQDTVNNGFFDPLIAEQVVIEKPVIVTPPTLTLTSFVLLADGAEVQPDNGRYYIDTGATIEFSAIIKDGEAISKPLVKMVCQEFADDAPVGREIYITCAINSGVISSDSFVFPLPTNYKITAERNNRALDRMAGGVADFHLSFDNIDLLT
jgi:hypothetical protein